MTRHRGYENEQLRDERDALQKRVDELTGAIEMALIEHEFLSNGCVAVLRATIAQKQENTDAE